jgi:hypothetical protein
MKGNSHSLFHTRCYVSNVIANGCYRDTNTYLGSSTTYGCPGTISMSLYGGPNTVGQLSNVWYPNVTTLGAPAQGYEDWQVLCSGCNANCDYSYWDSGSGTYQVWTHVKAASNYSPDWLEENTSTHTCNF